MNHQSAPVTLADLTNLFYATPEDLGKFDPVEAAQTPADYAALLDHHSHMTVTLERHHRSTVALHVLAKRVDAECYSRKILLTRESDGRPVLFGIVRLHLSFLPDNVADEIRNEKTPLGRILITWDVLREVQRLQLLRITPGQELQASLGLVDDQPIYGRTALIFCNGEPAIELLEIVRV